MLTIDELIRILWRRRLVFLVTFVVTLGAAAVVTFSLHKQYSTTAFLYVSAASGSSNSFDQIQISQVTTKTYSELMQTRNIANIVSRRLPFPQSGSAVQNAVGVSPVTGSALITLTATGSTPRRAQQLANTYATTFVHVAPALAAGTLGVTRISLAANAPLITSPSRPKPVLYLVIGGIVALFVAIGAALLRHRTDQRLELDPAATTVNGLPVLGWIPAVPSNLMGDRPLEPNPALTRYGMNEALQMLLTNLAFVNGGDRPRTIAIVSAGPNEGKSTVCTQLARAAVERGVATLLVDADLRRGRLQAVLNVNPQESGPGLSAMLLHPERFGIEDGAIELLSSLSLVPAGPALLNPAALFGSPALAELVNDASQRYGLVIFDPPPISVGADASLVAAAVEGVVLVVDLRSTTETTLAQSISQLTHARANVLGVVINRTRHRAASGYYYSYESNGAGRGGRRRGGRRQLLSALTRRGE